MTGQADRWVDSSGHLAGGTIGQHDAVIGANDQHDIGNGVNNCLQEGPRPPDCFLHFAAMGDVVDSGFAEGALAFESLFRLQFALAQ